MVTVSLISFKNNLGLDDQRLVLKSNFFYRNRIKNLSGAVYNPEDRTWSIPVNTLDELKERFDGELFFKTPEWVIRNEPMPDMSSLYKLDMNITPPALKLPMYNYQEFGVKFLIEKIIKNNFCILADSVGTGKTIHGIAVMKWFYENKNCKKFFVVGKKSIKSQWVEEIQRFWKQSNDQFYVGYTKQTPSQRKKEYAAFAKADSGICVTNYHTFLNDADQISALNVDFVIIDEVHSIKSRTGVINRNIRAALKGHPTLFLTGTPILSKPEDLFGIVQIADDKYFGTWTNFKKKFLTLDMHPAFGGGPVIVGAKNMDKLRKLSQDILIRRTEYEIDIDLPDTMIQTISCDMDTTQQNILAAIQEEQDILTARKKSLSEKADPKSYEQLYKIEAQGKGLIAAKQGACNDPIMFKYSKSKKMQTAYASMIPKSYSMSDKFEKTCDIVEDILSNDEKVVIFTKYRTSALLLGKALQKKTKAKPMYYTGAEDEDAREQIIKSFRNVWSPDTNIIIGTDALSEGVNLQVAKYLINLDQPDTAAIKTQRIGRIRRVGSKADRVIIYDMITKSMDGIKSKDEERLENIQKTQDVADAFINSNKAQSIALRAAMKAS